MKKSSSKIWWFEKFVLPLQPLSLLNSETMQKVLRKSFLKKVSKKFGGLKNLPYLCTTFPPQIMRYESELKMVL